MKKKKQKKSSELVAKLVLELLKLVLEIIALALALVKSLGE